MSTIERPSILICEGKCKKKKKKEKKISRLPPASAGIGDSIAAKGLGSRSSPGMAFWLSRDGTGMLQYVLYFV